MELYEIARKSCELRGENPDASLGGDGKNFLWMEVLVCEVNPTLAALEALEFVIVPKKIPPDYLLQVPEERDLRLPWYAFNDMLKIWADMNDRS